MRVGRSGGRRLSSDPLMSAHGSYPHSLTSSKSYNSNTLRNQRAWSMIHRNLNDAYRINPAQAGAVDGGWDAR